MPRLPASAALTLALALALVAPAGALTIDFEEFSHGQFVEDGDGWSVVTENFNKDFDIGLAFDTNMSNTADPDLEFGQGWAGGNLAPDTDLGNIMIIQENLLGCSFVSGFCDDPDDEQRRPAGSFDFDFGGVSFLQFSFDLIDVDDAVAERGSIAFFLGDTQVAFYDFTEFTQGEFAGQGVQYGNNTANRITFADLPEFDAISIVMGGSGGIDNLNAVVPEPGTAALLALGLSGLTWVGRRRG